jgi:hypothetical protein
MELFESCNVHKENKSTTARMMYGLFRYYGGLRFTGVISTTKQGIIDYLNRTYVLEYTNPETGKVTIYPDWNKDAFCIKEIEIDLV